MSMSVTMLQGEEQRTAERELVLASPHKRARASLKTTSRLLSVLPPLILGLILLVSWYAGTASGVVPSYQLPGPASVGSALWDGRTRRSEEHTSELQSRQYLVCRLLLEKKKNQKNYRDTKEYKSEKNTPALER